MAINLINIKNLLINFALSLLSLFLTFSILEISVRIYENDFSFQNFLLASWDLTRSAYPTAFDQQLGWIPKKGNYPENVWNTNITILNDGIRSNGHQQPIKNNPIILAVGDSFTFGDQVSNHETWPAQLERKSSTKVINGGVFGYGIDQTYLRMLALAEKYHPNIIIFSFIRDDIDRCELSERTSVPKPYFNITKDDDITLMNYHIPPNLHPETSLNTFKTIIGYSLFTHQIMSKIFPEYWFQGSWRSVQIHTDGLKVTCQLLNKLKDYALKKHIKLYLLVQYTLDGFERNRAIIDHIIQCIDKNILTLIDMHHPLANLKKHNPQQYENLFNTHMTKAGNEFVASLLLEKIAADIQ